MFKEKFIKLCSQKGVSPTSVCLAVGLSNSAYTQWSEHSMPRKTTLVKICDYFGVPYDYFDTNQNLPKGTYHGRRLVDDNETNKDDNFTYAAYNELTHDLTPHQIEQLKNFADFLRQQN